MNKVIIPELIFQCWFRRITDQTIAIRQIWQWIYTLLLWYIFWFLISFKHNKTSNDLRGYKFGPCWHVVVRVSPYQHRGWWGIQGRWWALSVWSSHGVLCSPWSPLSVWSPTELSNNSIDLYQFLLKNEWPCLTYLQKSLYYIYFCMYVRERDLERSKSKKRFIFILREG